MPALSSISSFITYRPGKKAKAAIRSPFSLLRGLGDSGATASSSPSHLPFIPPTPEVVYPIVVEPDVIDINHSHYSDNGIPSASFEQEVFDNPRSSQLNLSVSPQVEPDIDISSKGFSDWLEAFPSKKEALAKRRLTRLNLTAAMNVKLDELKEEGETRGPSLSEDMVSSLQTLDHDDILQLDQEFSSLRHPYAMSITDTSPTKHQASRPSNLSIGTSTGRPLSSQSIASSAVSGTTIARALMSNSFILSTDRSSLHRSGTGAGLTRADSATLPNWEWNSHIDTFSIASDAPPIPSNAELLYEPPRRLRNEGKRSKQSSTVSLSPKIPAESPSISNHTRINSVIVSADHFDLEPGTPPRTPLRVAIDEAMTPDQTSQQTTAESQLLSQGSDTLSSPSSCHTSPKELVEGLLNYYSLPDSPELLVAGRGFRPVFSPITEESSSQSSPPTPYRSDRRDSQNQLVAGRSPHRARDSTVLPKDPHVGAQSNIASRSTPSSGSDSFSIRIDGSESPELITSIFRPSALTISDDISVNGTDQEGQDSSESPELIPSTFRPSALTISSVSGDGPIAVNGSDQEDSAELEESQEPQHLDSPGSPAFSPTKGTLVYRSRGRSSDVFRGTSLGSPPPYYSVVNESLQNNRFPNSFTSPLSFSQSPGSDNMEGPSSGESMFSNDIGRARESTQLGQRTTRTRPPLPAGPRRPSQANISPGPHRGSFSSVSSNNAVPDLRLTRPPPPRFNNSTPSPSFQIPTPKWKGYTLEVAKWIFTSAQLQAIVSKAIRRSAESSSIRLLRLEVLDNDIPEEIEKLESQRTNIKLRYKSTTRRRAIILDSMYSVEDVHGLIRQLDELRELTLTLDRLAEELHSMDQQLSYLESLTHIHNGSALAIALRKLNTSFLRQVAENQVLRGQIQTLEAERDEAWQQAQSIANDYDQIINNNNIGNPDENAATAATYSPSSSTISSRISAKRKSCIRVSKSGLRTTSISRRPSQRLSAGASIGGNGSAATRSPPLALPIRRPLDILTDSPNAFSATGFRPSSEARELAQVQDELFAMLGILNPDRKLRRSRSEIISTVLSPRRLSISSAPRPSSNAAVAIGGGGGGGGGGGESPKMRSRRDSLPGALSLTEAYNVMAVDRNAVLATIDMLDINSSSIQPSTTTTIQVS